MATFLYNLYIFGIHLWTMLYPKPCYYEPCYKKVNVYFVSFGIIEPIPVLSVCVGWGGVGAYA